MLRDTPTKQFRHTLSQLGPEYTSKIIDGELCGYLKMNEKYDIEISGMNNNRIKRPNFNIYVWDCSPGYRIIEQHHNIKSIIFGKHSCRSGKNIKIQTQTRNKQIQILT